uniref:Fatty acid desaturase domain-containing protein n=2 Tax=Meloidogyne TaxID=189290 RepID=A0A914KM23_MELIC
MPPLNVSTPQQFRQNGKMTEEDEMFLTMEVNDLKELEEKAKAAKFKTQVVWRNVGLYVLLQTGATIGLYQLFFTAKWLSVAWVIILWMVSGVGITAGPHRLWSHKSYKAKTPLKIILMFMNCVAFQNDVIEWSRDHRCHHKWTDTDADPHNINRGFFFAHMGWLLCKKHPLVREKGATLDMSDLTSEPVLAFQRKYYLPLVFIFCFLLPTATAVFLWGESVWIAFCTAALFRYCLNLHATWFINSAAHTFGYKPYDVAIKATESMLTTLTAWGEGGHNYHHTFPQDYRTSEMLGVFNFSRLFIDFFAKIGWAYDLKTVDEKTIQRQMGRQLERLKEEEKKNIRIVIFHR